MPEALCLPNIPGITLQHAHTTAELTACYPVIVSLRPSIKSAAEWVERAMDQAVLGYRVLAAWDGARAVGVAGYRTSTNLIHGDFLYVDDLVTAPDRRGSRLGSALLAELEAIARDEGCARLVLDTAATNTDARRFYKREGLTDAAVGFIKTLEVSA